MAEEEDADGQKAQSTHKATYCKYESREWSFRAYPDSKKRAIAWGPCPGRLWSKPGALTLLINLYSCEGCDRGPKTLCGTAPGLGIAGSPGAGTTQRVERGKNTGETQFKHPFLSILSPSPNPSPLTRGTSGDCNDTECWAWAKGHVDARTAVLPEKAASESGFGRAEGRAGDVQGQGGGRTQGQRS